MVLEYRQIILKTTTTKIPRYELDKPRVDYTLARGTLRRGAQLGAIGPIGLRPALEPAITEILTKHNPKF